MHRNSSTIIVFVVLFLLAALIFILQGSLSGVSGFVSNFTRPLQSNLFIFFNRPPTAESKKVQQIIYTIAKQAQMNQLKNDNAALRDQFATANLDSTKLLPAKIIGLPGLMPGVSLPEQLILDQGTNQGVQNGMAVVIKNILLGEVTRVEATTCLVTLISQPNFLFTAHTQNTNTLGIVKGEGLDKVALVNVELSDTLKIGDIVITKGEENLSGKGLPPGLVIGKITAINKPPSALYQTAAIGNPVDITKLSQVFIMLK